MNAQQKISQYSKFSPITVKAKSNLRQMRLDAGYSMREGARMLGVSQKQLEDIETHRNYGCHLDLELLARAAVVYKTPITAIVGSLPQDPESTYFERPRKAAKKIR